MSRWLGSEEGQAELARLRDNDPELVKLYLWEKVVGDDGATAIAEGLKTNSALQVLQLERNDVGAAGATAIAEGLKTNSTLQTLNLGFNKVGAAGATAMAEGLKTNSTLQTLNLHNNKVGDAGATAMAEGLKTNSTLQELNLQLNKVGDAGAAALFGSGASLRVLYLGQNAITTVPGTVRGLTRLEELYLNNNKLVSVDGAIVALEGTLRKIDLSGNGDTLLQPPAPYARDYDGTTGDSSLPAALFRYFREEKVPYFRVKLVLVGDEHAGKTSTWRTLRDGAPSCAADAAQPAAGSAAERARETVGVVVRAWRPGPLSLAAQAASWLGSVLGAAASAEELLEFRVFDLAGQVVYRASHQCAFSAHALYTCVVDATDDADAAAAKVLGWYDYLQDSVPGALFRLLLTHIDAPAAGDWRAKGAALLARLRAHEAARRRALELRLAALEERKAQHPWRYHRGGSSEEQEEHSSFPLASLKEFAAHCSQILEPFKKEPASQVAAASGRKAARRNTSIASVSSCKSSK